MNKDMCMGEEEMVWWCVCPCVWCGSLR